MSELLDKLAERERKGKLVLPKVKSRAFGKDVYLLGKDKHGERVWLEAAKWDCGWYWGFGYIERYTSANPATARDISSHTHWNSEIVGKHEYYDSEKQCFRLSSDYVHHLNESPVMAQTTLNERESWELAELMKTFYTLKEAAEVFGRGKSHVANTTVSVEEKAWAERINKELLPRVFARVYELLSPAA